MKRHLFVLIVFISIPSLVLAQLEKPVIWSFYSKKINKTEAVVYIKAKMSDKWHIYAQNNSSEAMRLKINYNKSKNFNLIGKTIEPMPIKKYDPIVKMNLAYFEKEVIFTQKIKLNGTSAFVEINIEFMACNDKQCLPADEISFKIPIK